MSESPQPVKRSLPKIDPAYGFPVDPEYFMPKELLTSETDGWARFWEKNVEDWKEMLTERGYKDEKFDKELQGIAFDALANVGRANFWFFLTECLLWKGLSPSLHGDMAKFLMQPGNEKMFLVARGHLKSTLITVAYVMWRIVRNPDIRILIANYKLDNAKAFLYQIRSEFTNNKTILMLFSRSIPDLKKVKWNESQITFRRKKNMKEATIEVAGVGGEITGKHYDLIIYDDLVGPQNITTLDQIQNLKQWYNQTQSILEPGGEQIIIGTRWHFADLYGFIMENLMPPFKLFKRSAFKADGSPEWPEKFTTEALAHIKMRMEADPKQGRQLFVAQYLNEVIDEATASFRRDKLRFFHPDNAPKGMAVSITVDPAISEKESADRSAFVVRGNDQHGTWWILETFAKRGMSPTDIVDKIFELYRTYMNKGYMVEKVAVETQAFQKALSYSIREKMRKENTYFMLQELGAWKQSKELRIKALIPRFDLGAIMLRHPSTGDDTEILVDELLRFPKGQHDDLIDALAFCNEVDISEMYVPNTDNSEDSDNFNGRDRYGGKIVSNQSMGGSGFFGF